MKSRFVLSLLSLTLACVAACVESIPPDTLFSPSPQVTPQVSPPEAPQAPKAAFLQGFSPIPDSEYTSVGCLLTEQREIIGSAVLVGKKHILTAGHCFDGTEAYWFKTNGKEYRICKQTFHPLFKLGEKILYDLAIGELETDCLETPACLSDVTVFYFSGKPLTAVGYGGGIRKKSDYGTIWYYGTLEESPKYFKMLPTHGTIWFGDSGGAIFGSDGQLLGIISSLSGRQGIIYENSAIRVDRFLGWINLVVEEDSSES